MNEQTSTTEKQKIRSPKKTTEKSNVIDLTVGNPSFMQDYWQLVDKYYAGAQGLTRIKSSEGMSYNYNQENDKLRDDIRSLHSFVGNAVTDGYQIVFGNGAGQLLAASVFATCMKNNGEINFTYTEPCWPKIPALMNLGRNACGAFTADVTPVEMITDESNLCELVVYPNNPDNELSEKKTKARSAIHDMSYFWPQYTKIRPRAYDVMIFGLAKATGHAGTRFGWALVKDEELAKLMTDYVTLTTSGVSYEAQERAHIVMDTIARLQKDQFTSCFDTVKSELNSRWIALQGALKGVDAFTLENGGGMFAWCALKPHAQVPDLPAIPPDEIENKLEIKVLYGSRCGPYPGHFRISMGSSKAEFNELIKRIKTQYGASATKKA